MSNQKILCNVRNILVLIITSAIFLITGIGMSYYFNLHLIIGIYFIVPIIYILLSGRFKLIMKKIKIIFVRIAHFTFIFFLSIILYPKDILSQILVILILFVLFEVMILVGRLLLFVYKKCKILDVN